MVTAVEATVSDRSDVRTIVGGGIQLGIVTAIGVVLFALLSRSMTGRTEVLVQSGLVFAGGAAFAFLPAWWIRARSADGIAWAALLGLVGALAFTVLDVVALRPLAIYHWTWDEIGGGSGFWYIPVWWMGSAFLAWLGGMVTAYAGRANREVRPLALGIQAAVLGAIVFALLAVTVAPFHAAVAALAFAIGLVVHVPVSAAMHRT